MTTIRHILVGTDFSEASHAAMDVGCEMARALGAKLTVLYVHSQGAQAMGAAGIEDAMVIGREVHAALARIKNELTGVPDSKVEMVAEASPAAAIVDQAAILGVDLIVVGSQGLGGAKRFLLGSVADRVSRHAACSVLIARPAQSPG